MLSYQVEFSPKARKELLEAFLWYEEREEGLGERFSQHIHRKIETISDYPERYRKVKGIIRQVSIKKFPYCIIYYVKPKLNIVTIVSIFHHSRNPKNKFQ